MLYPTIPIPKKYNDSKYGMYLRNDVDVTGQSVDQAVVDASGQIPCFLTSETCVEPSKRAHGPIIRVNLIRATAGWKWIREPDGVQTTSLCTVETQGKHHYALLVAFRDGVTLSNYPDRESEPRLRPTTYGVLDYGRTVGSIMLRGRQHRVYSQIMVTRKSAKA